MRIERALLVYRKSMFQIYVTEHGEQAVQRALRRRDAVALGMRESHLANERALAAAQRALARLGVETVVRWRAHARAPRGYDLVISLGGDGTLLDTSHRIVDATPLLGVNTDPTRSVGALCAGTVDELPLLVGKLRAGALAPRRTTRLRVRIDGEEVLGPTLNDVLFAHTCPAGLTRVDLAVVQAADALASHSGRERAAFRALRCSGLWLASATGSTAAIHSAGGRVLPPRSRRLQYLVREPYRPSPEHPTRAAVAPGHAVVLVSRVRTAMVWADGPHRRASVRYSQQVVIDEHPQPLYLVR